MSRLNQERQEELEPKRMEYAKNKLQELGYTVTFSGKATITFIYRGHVVHFFPYSGWASGKTIKDGRGLDNLIKQLV